MMFFLFICQLPEELLQRVPLFDTIPIFALSILYFFLKRYCLSNTYDIQKDSNTNLPDSMRPFFCSIKFKQPLYPFPE